MKPCSVKWSCFFVLFLFLWTGVCTPSYGQNETSSDEYQEVYLSFRYRGIINSVVVAYYDPDSQSFYLPVTDLLNQLKINHQVDVGGLTVSGWFQDPDYKYRIDLRSNIARYRDREVRFEASDQLIREMDFFLKPAILDQLFGLNFTIDFNNLTLGLETDQTLPVVARYEREQQRQQMVRQPRMQQQQFPLRYDRQRHYLNGGFLDYTLSANISEFENIYTYNTSLGAEVLGGDIQGTAYGSYSDGNSNFLTNNLRWRYVTQHQDWLRSVEVGQTNTTGLANRAFTGVKISNEPIQPRVLYDQYVVDGNTIPLSDVELYLNNTLIDFQQADELGNYRFLIPLTYGSSQLRLKVYGPSGEVRTLDRRIQIPFTYLPPGEINYNVSAGRLDNPLIGSTEQNYTVQTDVGAGLTNWLTGKAGMEYYDNSFMDHPLLYGSLSARVATQYLVNMDIAPDAFYRLNTNVVYASAASWGLGYTYYTADRGIYNQTGSDQEIQGNLFLPFNLGSVPLNFRFSGTRQIRPGANLTRYQLDLNSRIDRLNIRLGYRDSQFGSLRWRTTQASRLTGTLTYTLSRTPGMPGYLQGTFLRSQLIYNPNYNELEEMDFQLSKDVFQAGRLQLTAGHNFVGDYNLLSLNLTIDFAHTRTNTTYRNTRNTGSLTQTIRGSVGFDSNTDDVIFDNRRQVGRSAAAVRMYVDNNNNHAFDRGDDLIPDNAIRLGRSSGNITERSGVTFLTQLQAYNRYNLEVNKSAIENPLLVPEMDQFSFVTDPNSYKPLDIPFYVSGVVSGNVTRGSGDTKRPVGGLRMYLKSRSKDFSKTLQTFSDGSFYTMEVPPGNYILYPDSTQLDFLDMDAKPARRTFTVEALAEGDFVEGLDFHLTPRDTTALARSGLDKSRNEKAEAPSPAVKPRQLQLGENYEVAGCGYPIQIASFTTQKKIHELAEATEAVVKNIFQIRYGYLYTVVSKPLGDFKQALSVLEQVQKNIAPEAILLNTCREQFYQPVIYRLKLATVASDSLARRLARVGTDSLGLTTEIRRQEGSPVHYEVITDTLRDWRNAYGLLQAARGREYFRNAEISYMHEGSAISWQPDYTLLLDYFDTPEEAEALKQSINFEGIDADKLTLQKGLSGTIYMVLYENVRGWNKVTQLQRLFRDHLPASANPTIVMNIRRDAGGQ